MKRGEKKPTILGRRRAAADTMPPPPSQIIPFVDMTVKGWVWNQGENNMGGVKGNNAVNIGYSCEQVALVQGWRQAWSKVPNTTDPLAPFGIVTLASSGSEGGPNMGPMRLAQTGNYGVR